MFQHVGSDILRKPIREKNNLAFELDWHQWKRVPIGLCSALASFQSSMAQALARVTKGMGSL